MSIYACKCMCIICVHMHTSIYAIAYASVCVCVLCHFSHVQLFATLWTVVLQTPLSMEILQARILEWVAMLSSKGSS